MDELEQYQETVVTRLKGADYFADHADLILVEKGPDIEAMIEQAIGRLGFCVIVGAPVLAPLAGEQESRPHFRVDVELAVIEQPALNQTGLTTLRGVVAAIRALYDKPGTRPNPVNHWRVTRVEPVQDKEVWAYSLVASATWFYSF